MGGTSEFSKREKSLANWVWERTYSLERKIDDTKHHLLSTPFFGMFMLVMTITQYVALHDCLPHNQLISEK